MMLSKFYMYNVFVLLRKNGPSVLSFTVSSSTPIPSVAPKTKVAIRTTNSCDWATMPQLQSNLPVGYGSQFGAYEFERETRYARDFETKKKRVENMLAGYL